MLHKYYKAVKSIDEIRANTESCLGDGELVLCQFLIDGEGGKGKGERVKGKG